MQEPTIQGLLNVEYKILQLLDELVFQAGDVEVEGGGDGEGGGLTKTGDLTLLADEVAAVAALDRQLFDLILGQGRVVAGRGEEREQIEGGPPSDPSAASAPSCTRCSTRFRGDVPRTRPDRRVRLVEVTPRIRAGPRQRLARNESQNIAETNCR